MTMSVEDDQSQSGYEDGLAGGPGAPTPLSALDVGPDETTVEDGITNNSAGCRRPHKA